MHFSYRPPLSFLISSQNLEIEIWIGILAPFKSDPGLEIMVSAALPGSLAVRTYRVRNKGLQVVARNFFLLLLNYSAWPCLGPA